MKRTILTAFVLFLAAAATPAQFVSPSAPAPAAPGSFSLYAWSRPVTLDPASLSILEPRGGVADQPATLAFCSSCALPSLAEAAPTPDPGPAFGGKIDDNLHWQLAIGYEYARFNSFAFNSNLSGVHTSLTYFPMDWFGLEGGVVAAFGTKQANNVTSRYLLYTLGPRISWRRRKWQPWVHALFGGLHMVPQAAGQGKNGFAMQFGGGVDYPLAPSFSVRVEADYVRSELYGSGQNNLQAGGGFVINF